MREIPILYSTPMVQAKKAGRKTMTRRIINPKTPEAIALLVNMEAGIDVDRCKEELIRCNCPYGAIGDRLWTRESFRKYILFDPDDERLRTEEIIDFAADGEEAIPMIDGDGFQIYNKDGSEKFIPYRPSIHMPKSVARIWDEVTNIRIERLHEITKEDAIAEGILYHNEDEAYYDYVNAEYTLDPLASFASLWKKINGIESWDANPWVWVIEYKNLSTQGKPKNL